MNVSCPQCSTMYRIDPAKVPAGGVRARCSACGGVIPVGIAERTSAAAPAFAGTGGGWSSPSPASATPTHMPPAQRQPTPTRPATLPPLRPTPRTAWPSVATPSGPSPAAPPPSTSGLPLATRPFIPSQTPISVPPVTPPPPRPVTPRSPAHATPAASSQVPPSRPAATQPAPGERRPINPFLARDPGLRAKRLARALVSDMVAYYPAKHSEGLQRGTLKELFRDEIKKSYEEYVAQVGADLARTTTHFQEALNEVLGAGKRIF
jgi:predicted Zn finger-like uncharacterized protein